MSVIPQKIDTDNQTIQTYHDGHNGEISFDDITFPKYPGTESDMTNFLYMPCPVCGAVTLHPVSGGAAPVEVQKLFTYKLQSRHTDRTFSQAKVLIREMVSNQDGLDRWRLNNMVEGD